MRQCSISTPIASNPVIGDRALSDQAGDVARLGAEIVAALQQGGCRRLW